MKRRSMFSLLTRDDVSSRRSRHAPLSAIAVLAAAASGGCGSHVLAFDPAGGGAQDSTGGTVDAATTGSAGSTAVTTGSTGSTAVTTGSTGSTAVTTGSVAITTGGTAVTTGTSADGTGVTATTTGTSADGTGSSAITTGNSAVSSGSTGTGVGTVVMPTGPAPHPTKADVLLMVDNSTGMGQKQQLLAAALPDLFSRLTNPNCVTSGGSQVVPAVNGQCPAGSSREFLPITDIHVGVISSSLGSHNAEVAAQERGFIVECTDADPGHPNDRAHLLTRGSSLSASRPFAELGGTSGNDLGTFLGQVNALVGGVGGDGCGYEAQLESIYRFLIDPTPPATFKRTDSPANPTYAFAYATVDNEILTERKTFLRPDSLVIVVLLSDENDCSVSDVSNASLYLEIDPNTLENPVLEPVNDPLGDQPNLRCFHQRQRYGQDGLWSVQRYIDGFSNLQLRSNLDGNAYDNPLYVDSTCPEGSTSCTRVRDPRLVLFTALSGVPWQDVTRLDSSGAPQPSLGLMSSSELAAAGRWGVVLGNPDTSVDPTDPFMIEARSPRMVGAMNPVVGAAIAAPTSPANATINGHEWVPTADLEYACTFPAIDGPTDCTPDKLADGTDGPAKCDCAGGDSPVTTLNPLCENPAVSPFAYGAIQYADKGYPAVRELQVAKALGDHAVVGSICASSVSSTTDPTYGYRPVMNAIIERVPR